MPQPIFFAAVPAWMMRLVTIAVPALVKATPLAIGHNRLYGLQIGNRWRGFAAVRAFLELRRIGRVALRAAGNAEDRQRGARFEFDIHCGIAARIRSMPS